MKHELNNLKEFFTRLRWKCIYHNDQCTLAILIAVSAVLIAYGQ